MVQWLRIHLPVQGTRVLSLVTRGTKIPHATERLSPHAATKTPGSQINKTTKNNLCKSQSSTDPQDDPSASMSLLLSNHKVAGAQGGRMESWLRSRDRQVPSSIGTRPSARTG